MMSLSLSEGSDIDVMKPSIKITLGLLTSLATICFILVYDFYLKERLDSLEVVVVKAGEAIGRSEQITAKKVVVERRSRESIVENVVLSKDLDKIIGLDSKQDLVGNSMMSHKMIDYEGMTPNPEEGEAIRPITNEMIYAKPGSLRRKDVIDIYLIDENGINKSINQTKNQLGQESSSDSDASTSLELSNSVNNKETKPFLKGIKVVYVKDSGNREVVSAAGENSPNKRLDATSTISDLEIILKEEDFTNLMEEVLGQGSKLYITYQ
jgi:hypothetical protein